MTIKALIVDDEYPIRQELRYLISNIKDVEVVGEAVTATEAMKLICAFDYDILFLDINLPGMNGLELAERVQSFPNKPYVVFITAYDNYALNAFSVGATDYVLKPVEQDSLNRVVNKIIQERNRVRLSPEGLNAGTEEKQSADRILAVHKGKIVLVDVNDICFAYREGEKVYVKTLTQKMLTKYTLKELEFKLCNNKFFRTHRSFIVNINRVKEIQPFFNGTWQLIINDDKTSEVPVSRSQVKKLRKILE